ncbi:MAG: T9SS type A sorting domain-containing protein [Melioribacteraceae bacterium]|nr:T9SS type A sorting domain-containing protein [Melioribacteraceae bacterium]MCF8432069.1 T9SS type A sorting domain-containing protein [Melioribacteraceae bacterium]
MYNSIGKEVVQLVNENKSAGTHTVTWNAADKVGTKVSSGVYFYKLTSGEIAESKKMILLR